MFDLDQVEVLRGPQGSLYGRNAVGGSINLITAKPTADFTGYARIGYGNYSAMIAEAAVGGPIGLLKNGDTIRLDATKGTLEVDLSAAELSHRRKAWKPRKHDYQSGALWRYAQTVGDAREGAVTHPGAAAETHVYADL